MNLRKFLVNVTKWGRNATYRVLYFLITLQVTSEAWAIFKHLFRPKARGAIGEKKRKAQVIVFNFLTTHVLR